MEVNMDRIGTTATKGGKKKPVVKKNGAESEATVEQVGMKVNSQIALESALMTKTSQDIVAGLII